MYGPLLYIFEMEMVGLFFAAMEVTQGPWGMGMVGYRAQLLCLLEMEMMGHLCAAIEVTQGP